MSNPPGPAIPRTGRAPACPHGSRPKPRPSRPRGGLIPVEGPRRVKPRGPSAGPTSIGPASPFPPTTARLNPTVIPAEAVHQTGSCYRGGELWPYHVQPDGLHLGRASADHQSEAPGLDDALQVGPVIREMLRPHLEGYRAPLAGRQRDAPEALQLHHRPGGSAHLVADVELDDLVAAAHPGVGRLGGKGGPAVRCDPRGRDRRGGVREGDVREAVPEREERPGGLEAVASHRRGLAVVEERQLPPLRGKLNGSFPPGFT